MTNIDDILNEAAAESTPVFKESVTGSGYVRSGKSLATVQPEGNKIVGHVSISTLIFGRPPGTQPPSGYIQGTETPTDLMEWCMEIFNETAKEARGTSFVIARSLKEKGNKIYQGTAAPIPTDGTVEKATQVVFDRVLKNFNEAFKAYGL